MGEPSNIPDALEAFEHAAMSFFHEVQQVTSEQAFDMTTIFGGYQLLMLR